MGRPISVSFQFDGMFDIPGVERDASALAVHSETGNLWAITDDDVRLVEFTSQGKFVREVKLIGFEDTEGVCHVGGDRFLIAEEKKMRVTLIDVQPGSTTLAADGRNIELDVKSKKNKGLEGVSYDPETDTLFAVREDKPPAVYRVHPLQARNRSTKEWPLDLEGFDDLSDTFFDAPTGWLWLLSDESKIAAAFDSQGQRVIELRLKKGRHGLPENVEQAEGIARDSTGTLYVCSEPNHIYRFASKRSG
jgi:uncharacterized protein YjiK